jgi:hypothetical protein
MSRLFRVGLVAITMAALTACASSSAHGAHAAHHQAHSQAALSSRTTLGARAVRLYDTTWTLTRIDDSRSETTQVPTARIVLRIHRSGILVSGCAAAAATVRGGRMVFRHQFITTTQLASGCGPHLTIEQNNFTFGLLTGSVHWSITGTTLRLGKPGVGWLTFQAGV